MTGGSSARVLADRTRKVARAPSPAKDLVFMSLPDGLPRAPRCQLQWARRLAGLCAAAYLSDSARISPCRCRTDASPFGTAGALAGPTTDAGAAEGMREMPPLPHASGI